MMDTSARHVDIILSKKQRWKKFISSGNSRNGETAKPVRSENGMAYLYKWQAYLIPVLRQKWCRVDNPGTC